MEFGANRFYRKTKSIEKKEKKKRGRGETGELRQGRGVNSRREP